MKSHLPILIFSAPLFTAISMPMISAWRPRWCRPMALGAAAVMSVIAVLNLALVVLYGETRYVFGGWSAPLGIEWVADAAASAVAAAIAAIATVCLAYEGLVPIEAKGSRVGLHYVLILVLLSGLTGVVFAGDLFNVFVFLEVATLATCALVAMAGGKALVFAFRYLILASIGATFFLLGVSFLYAVTGTLNMADMAAAARPAGGIQRGDHRRGVHVPGPVDQDGADAVSRLAARCLHPGAGRDFAAHLGPGHQGVAVCLDPNHVLGARCRQRVRAGPGAPRLLDAGRGGGGRRGVSRPHPARHKAHVRLRRRIAHRADHAGRRPGQPDGAGRVACST